MTKTLLTLLAIVTAGPAYALTHEEFRDILKRAVVANCAVTEAAFEQGFDKMSIKTLCETARPGVSDLAEAALRTVQQRLADNLDAMLDFDFADQARLSP